MKKLAVRLAILFLLAALGEIWCNCASSTSDTDASSNSSGVGSSESTTEYRVKGAKKPYVTLKSWSLPKKVTSVSYIDGYKITTSMMAQA